MKELPDEIWTRILSELWLLPLVALSLTSERFQSLVNAVDSTIVRDAVLERVPWMEPFHVYSTWLQCGVIVLARASSQSKEPDLWTFLDASTSKKTMKRLAANDSVEYLPVIDVSGSTLPATFKPMFETQVFWQPNKMLRGKYMTVNGCTLDATNMEWFREMPVKDPEPKSWYGVIKSTEGAVVCPLSKIRVTSSNSEFRLIQETERWLLIERESESCILDKQRARENTITTGIESAAVVLPKQMPNQLLFQFFPNQKAAFVLIFTVNSKQAMLNFLDLENRRMKQLAVFPATFEDYWYNPVFADSGVLTEATTPRDFVVPYGGTLWLNHHERELIPLWADLTEGLGGVQEMGMSTLRLRPAESRDVDEGSRTCRLYHSADGRFVTHYYGLGRIVCDLATGITYIVKDRGWKMGAGASFIGTDETDHPKFYTFTLRWLTILKWIWVEPPDCPDSYFDEKTPYNKQNLLEMIEDNEDDGHIFGEDNMEEIKELLVKIDDQDEGDGAGEYTDEGSQYESFSDDDGEMIDEYGEFVNGRRGWY